MANFDFINGDEFRNSLEADYTELTLAMQNKAWKSVLILAGSIIEAVLIDYLVSSNYQKKSTTDPLNMSLAEVISICRKENVLSETTEHLSHTIRSYRKLIHPSRSVRLGETATENKAKLAQILIDEIIEEVMSIQQNKY